MGPAMLLLHETCHLTNYRCIQPQPGRVCAYNTGSANSFGLADPEYYITQDVDVVADVSPDVLQRGMYAATGPGQQLRIPAPSGVEWVRWPTEEQLRSGLF
jgi:hypothetical protein